jgi:hypothetical protein
MNTDPTMAAPTWGSASFAEAAGLSPTELSDLGRHLRHCSARSGPWLRLHFAAESMNGFVNSRLVTTLGLLSLPLLLLALLL